MKFHQAVVILTAPHTTKKCGFTGKKIATLNFVLSDTTAIANLREKEKNVSADKNMVHGREVGECNIFRGGAAIKLILHMRL